MLPRRWIKAPFLSSLNSRQDPKEKIAQFYSKTHIGERYSSNKMVLGLPHKKETRKPSAPSPNRFQVLNFCQRWSSKKLCRDGYRLKGWSTLEAIWLGVHRAFAHLTDGLFGVRRHMSHP